MSYSAIVYRVLIASPSDVQEERQVIPAAIHDWNNQHSVGKGIVLLPVMWETHAAPMLGRPQEVINSQLVRSCDMLIGCFWTRLGSPTGIADSGTVEEIDWFVEQERSVMLYFSKRAMPSDCDLTQVQKVRDFKNKMSKGALIMEYEDVGQLHSAILRQLSTVVDNITLSPIVDVELVRKADKRVAAKTARSEKAASVPKQVRPKTKVDPQFTLHDYTERSFVVFGPIKSVETELKEMHGKWTNARGRIVMMFAKRHVSVVAQFLGLTTDLLPFPDK